MPKCPICNGNMKVKKTDNKEEILICDTDGVFIPKSVFGVTGS